MSANRYHLVINPRYAGSAALRSFVEGLPHRFDEVGKLVFEKRNAVRVIDDNFGCKHLSGVAVKRFKDPGFIRGLYYTFIGTTKAYRAYTNARELLKRGIETPEHIAYIEERKGGLKRIGFLVTAKMALPSIKDDLYYEDSVNGDIAERFGEYVAELHYKGILHRDLNCDNVLIDKRSRPPRFALIDVNRMTFSSPGEELDKTLRMWNLCQFTRSERNVRLVAEAYARKAGFPAGFAEDTVRYKRRFNIRRARKKRFAKLFKKRRK